MRNRLSKWQKIKIWGFWKGSFKKENKKIRRKKMKDKIKKIKLKNKYYR